MDSRVVLMLAVLAVSAGAVSQRFVNFSDPLNYTNMVLVLQAGDSLNNTGAYPFSLLANGSLVFNVTNVTVQNVTNVTNVTVVNVTNATNCTAPALANFGVTVDRKLSPGDIYSFSNATYGIFERLECSSAGNTQIEKDVKVGDSYGFSGCGVLNISCVGAKETVNVMPDVAGYCAPLTSSLQANISELQRQMAGGNYSNGTCTTIVQQQAPPAQGFTLFDGLVGIGVIALGYLLYKRYQKSNAPEVPSA